MEFEDDKPVAEPDRRLANAKRVDLNPVHEDSDLNAGISSNENSQLIGNVDSDREDTAKVLNQQANKTKSRSSNRKLTAFCILFVIIFTAAVVLASVFYN